MNPTQCICMITEHNFYTTEATSRFLGQWIIYSLQFYDPRKLLRVIPVLSELSTTLYTNYKSNEVLENRNRDNNERKDSSLNFLCRKANIFSTIVSEDSPQFILSLTMNYRSKKGLRYTLLLSKLNSLKSSVMHNIILSFKILHSPHLRKKVSLTKIV